MVEFPPRLLCMYVLSWHVINNKPKDLQFSLKESQSKQQSSSCDSNTMDTHSCLIFVLKCASFLFLCHTLNAGATSLTLALTEQLLALIKQCTPIY